MVDEKLIPKGSICEDLDLPLRRLRGAAHAIELLTYSPYEIEEGDLWFIDLGIHDAIREIREVVTDIDRRLERRGA